MDTKAVQKMFRELEEEKRELYSGFRMLDTEDYEVPGLVGPLDKETVVSMTLASAERIGRIAERIGRIVTEDK